VDEEVKGEGSATAAEGGGTTADEAMLEAMVVRSSEGRELKMEREMVMRFLPMFDSRGR
jgi:hypothetical protein